MSETTTTTQEAQTLEEILFEQPYRFDFFQAVRLLERVYEERRPVGQRRRQAGQHPIPWLPGIGRGMRPGSRRAVYYEHETPDPG